MADFTIEGGLVINSSAALQAVSNIGRKIDELFAKMGLSSKGIIDPKPSTDALKKIGQL